MNTSRKRDRAGDHATRFFLFSVLLSLSTVTHVQAQLDQAGGFLPRTRYFTSPFADPMEPRFAVGLLVTDVLASPGQERQDFFLPDADDARTDWQASAALGGTIPLWRVWERRQGGIVIGAQAGVFARFRIELPSRDDLGQDWVVGMPIEAAWNDWSGRLRISHRSSHLGDEFVEATDAERIEFGGEALDALTAYHVSGIGRVYAGGSWIFRSYTDGTIALLSTSTKDRFLVQLGADGQWKAGSDNITLRAGVDWQMAERTEWEGAFAIAGGVAMQHDGRSLGFVARYFDGVSSMGQFFITPERFISLELVADF